MAQSLADFIERLRLSTTLILPLEAVRKTFAVLSSRSMRRTHAATVLVEEMVSDRVPVVVVDSLGVWHGLRFSADGRDPGLPVNVLGGRHGDAPLEECSTGTAADRAVDENQSLVLDVSLLSTSAARRVVQELAAHILSRRPRALHLVLDEADTLVPERVEGTSDPIIELLRSRGARGVGVTLVSQHPALVNPAILAEAEVLIAARMLGADDRNAIARWIEYHANPSADRGLIESLESLAPNEAWFWSPAWLGTIRRVRIRHRATYDGLVDVRKGALRPPQSYAAEVELRRLLTRLGSTESATRSEDNAVKARPPAPVALLMPEGDLASIEHLTKLMVDVAQRLATAVAQLCASSAPAPSAFSSSPAVEPPAPPDDERQRELGRGRRVERLVLTSEEKLALQRYAQDYRVSPVLAERARIVLACAEGRLNGDVARELKISIQMVGKWRRQFVQRRLDGLSSVARRLPSESIVSSGSRRTTPKTRP